jgi:GTP-binding protein
MEEEGQDLTPLFRAILDEIPPPMYDPHEPFQMLVADLDYSDYLGRLAVGKVFHGTAWRNEDLVCLDKEGKAIPLKISNLQVYDGINLKEVESAQPGDIIILAGIEDVEIGDTICTREAPKALPRISVDEPTISMLFTSSTSPLSGKEGKFVQSGKIRERLYREALRNVAIRVEDAGEADSFIVKGRGEFQMAILIETMRREGFELTVGRPQVIYKRKSGKILEPVEHLFIDCDENFIGVVSEKLSRRKGRMVNLVNHGTGRVRMEFTIPSRSLIGYRNEFLTDTKGTGIMNSYLKGYEEYRGDFPLRMTGSLVSDRRGESVSYALFNLEPRGILFLAPGEPVYEGMIIGEHNRENDINVNPCKMKKLTNMRASNKDDSIQLSPVIPLTLERAIEFIKDDEMVEATPRSIRLRKTILSAEKRHRSRVENLNG